MKWIKNELSWWELPLNNPFLSMGAEGITGNDNIVPDSTTIATPYGNVDPVAIIGGIVGLFQSKSDFEGGEEEKKILKQYAQPFYEQFVQSVSDFYGIGPLLINQWVIRKGVDIYRLDKRNFTRFLLVLGCLQKCGNDKDFPLLVKCFNETFADYVNSEGLEASELFPGESDDIVSGTIAGIPKEAILIAGILILN